MAIARAGRWSSDSRPASPAVGEASEGRRGGLGHFDWHVRPGIIRRNAQLKRNLGLTEHELGEGVEEGWALLHPEDRPGAEARVAALLRSEATTSARFEARYRHRAGHYVRIGCSLEVLDRDEARLPIRIFGTHELLGSEAEGSAAMAGLLRRLQARDAQLRSVAHLASHNLSGPIANLDDLLREWSMDAESLSADFVWEKLHRLSVSLRETMSYLGSVLEVGRLAAPEMTEVRLDEAWAAACQPLAAVIEGCQARVEVDFAALPSIRYHAPYVANIFGNLLSNALRYRHGERRCEVWARSWRDAEGEHVSVSDNGLGIDLSRHGHRLFTPGGAFHRHHEARGYGLFLIKAQIESLGGRIAVTSDVGKGTCFYVCFNQP